MLQTWCLIDYGSAFSSLLETFLRAPSLWPALEATYCMCLDQVSVLSKVTPTIKRTIAREREQHFDALGENGISTAKSG